MSDLNTLLQQYVDRSEPSLPPDPAPAITRGRGRVRTRRLLAATTVTAVLVAAGAVALPRLDGDASSNGRGIDPATADALADYDARAMPAILTEHVGAVLARSVTDLPGPVFFAGDGQGRPLGPQDYDKASGMSLTYGQGTDHEWSVDLSHAKSEAEGNSVEQCETDVSSGIYLSCDASLTPGGDLVIDRLSALRPAGGGAWMVVTADKLDRVDPDRLFFSRDVKVVHSETFLTYAHESVRAPDLATAERLFETPVADLVELGTDPELVIPPPPVDDSGCGPWTKDPGVTYC